MKPVRLEFPSSRRGVRRWLLGNSGGSLGALSLPVLAIGLVAAALCGWQFLETRAQLAATRDALHATQAAKSQPRAALVSAALSAQQRTAWNQVVRQLNTPWSALLDALEAATPDDIALVSIEPHAAQGIIRLQVEAKTLDVLLAYAGTLKAIDSFEGVALSKHETNDQDSSRPIRLSLDIRLKSRSARTAPQEVAR